jgi:hypothetical protein
MRQIHRWIAAGAGMGVLLLAGMVFLATMARRAELQDWGQPQLTVIAFQTSTAIPPESTQDLNGIGAASTSQPRVSSKEDFSIGDLVEVNNTGGEGLRLRNEPNLSSLVEVVGLDNEVFEVKGGPTESDGYIWWFLVNPYDNAKQGWAVGEYLWKLGKP